MRPRVIGRPAAGFEIAGVASDPPEVRVAGPRSRVREIESAFTEPVSVEAARDTVTEAVGVGLEDPLLRLEGGSRVRVTARVREAQETRTFDGLPVEARGRAARIDAGPRQRVGRPGRSSQVRRTRGRPTCAPSSPFRARAPLPARLPVAVEIGPGHPGGRASTRDAARRGRDQARGAGRDSREPAARGAQRSLFGTDGIRGVANVYPMTPELALALGRAVTFVAGRGQRHAPRVLIGKDTRLSGYMLETAIAVGRLARWAAACCCAGRCRRRRSRTSP